MHGLLPLVQPAARGEARQLAGRGGLVGMVHGQVGVLPVAEDAEAAELLALDVNPLLGVGTARAADLHLAHGPLLLAELLVDLQFDGQAVAVPPGHERRVEPLHAPAFDHDILENLVEGMADVNMAVGVGRAIVQSEVGHVRLRFADAAVEFQLGPALQDLRFALRQAGAHREIGDGKIKGVLVVHGPAPALAC